METRVLPAGDEAIVEAIQLLRAGEVVALPTETVYGLAANALDEDAVRRIFAAKGRPGDNPLITHIASLDMLRELATDIPKQARQLAKVFWPGPLTLVLKSRGKVAPSVGAGLDTLGVRMPANETALEVIRRSGLPLAAPSANLSGSPSPTKAKHVLADMNGRIPLILDDGASPVGVESTVLSLVGEPTLLRPGFVTAEEIEEVIGRKVAVAGAVLGPLEQGRPAPSPGMKYSHYAPRAKMILVEGGLAAFAAYTKERAAEDVWALCFEGDEDSLELPGRVYGRVGDAASQAAGLFSALRALDRKGAVKIYARAPAREGVGLAVYNRMLRAAGFRRVHLDESGRPEDTCSEQFGG